MSREYNRFKSPSKPNSSNQLSRVLRHWISRRSGRPTREFHGKTLERPNRENAIQNDDAGVDTVDASSRCVSDSRCYLRYVATLSRDSRQFTLSHPPFPVPRPEVPVAGVRCAPVTSSPGRVRSSSRGVVPRGM